MLVACLRMSKPEKRRKPFFFLNTVFSREALRRATLRLTVAERP
jgi:hypothetical protein